MDESEDTFFLMYGFKTNNKVFLFDLMRDRVTKTRYLLKALNNIFKSLNKLYFK